MPTTNTTSGGQDLRAARERVGLTRAQLAGLCGCSLGSLANIEQGAVPRHSRVLEAALAAIAEHSLDNSSPAGKPGSRKGSPAPWATESKLLHASDLSS